MTDRLYIASEVTRRLNYIQRDTWELARLLRGQRLSPGFHEALSAAIADLQRLADDTKPHAKTAEAQPQSGEKVDAA
jgi:hypothetical protein